MVRDFVGPIMNVTLFCMIVEIVTSTMKLKKYITLACNFIIMATLVSTIFNIDLDDIDARVWDREVFGENLVVEKDYQKEFEKIAGRSSFITNKMQSQIEEELNNAGYDSRVEVDMTGKKICVEVKQESKDEKDAIENIIRGALDSEVEIIIRFI